MSRYFATYVAALVTMVAIDLLWLGVIAKPVYQQGIGHLMAEKPNITAAVLFYVVYPVGIVIFAIAPDAVSASWLKTFTSAALFGLFAYATYDLTNLATLKGWPISLAALDMAWGSLVTGIAALTGKAVFDRMSTAAV
jgi:uncharacterized membrane protein